MNNNKDNLPSSSPKKSKRKVKSEEYRKYKKYLKSEQFTKVRDEVFNRDAYKCRVCNWSPDDYDADKKFTHRTLTCHHVTYQHLYDELNHLDDCITLCNYCHAAIHKCVSNFQIFKNKPK